MRLIKIEINKTPKEIIEKIREKASDFNFIIREVFDMVHEFRSHGVEVQDNFVYYSVMLCNTEKAYKSISGNPLKGAILLPPKQVVIYKDNESKKTIIAYTAIEETDVKKLLPEDKKFQKELPESCNNIIRLIESIHDPRGHPRI